MGEKAVHSIRCTELEDRDCGDSQFPAIPELVQDFLFHLDLYKFKGPDGIHHKVPREMANFTARPLSVIFQYSWESGEVPVDSKWQILHKFEVGWEFIITAVTALQLGDPRVPRSITGVEDRGEECIEHLFSLHAYL